MAAATLGTVAWLQWPQSAPASRARQYLNVSACLLTGPRGVNPGSPAAPVWAAMESASLTTHVMVSYLADTGTGDTTDMLNTLAERRCGVIVTTGVTATQASGPARQFPRQPFLLVASGPALVTVTTAAPANVSVVAPQSAATRIDLAIRALAAAA